MWVWRSLLQTSHLGLCGIGSDGVAALLSACSLVHCGSHQFVFPVLRCCFSAHLHFVRSAAKRSHSVDVDSLRISHADIFISRMRAAGGSPPQCQLSVEDVFWNAAIFHTTDMTQPSQFMLSKQSVHTEKISTRQDISVGYFILPAYSQDTADASQVKHVEAYFHPGICSPCLAAIQYW